MERLRAFRKSQKITQEVMAFRLGITVSMYEKVESGRANASSSFMRRMKKAFPDVSIDEIFFTDNRNIIAE